jgi:hypothetical protein
MKHPTRGQSSLSLTTAAFNHWVWIPRFTNTLVAQMLNVTVSESKPRSSICKLNVSTYTVARIPLKSFCYQSPFDAIGTAAEELLKVWIRAGGEQQCIERSVGGGSSISNNAWQCVHALPLTLVHGHAWEETKRACLSLTKQCTCINTLSQGGI